MNKISQILFTGYKNTRYTNFTQENVDALNSRFSNSDALSQTIYNYILSEEFYKRYYQNDGGELPIYLVNSGIDNIGNFNADDFIQYVISYSKKQQFKINLQTPSVISTLPLTRPYTELFYREDLDVSPEKYEAQKQHYLYFLYAKKLNNDKQTLLFKHYFHEDFNFDLPTPNAPKRKITRTISTFLPLKDGFVRRDNSSLTYDAYFTGEIFVKARIAVGVKSELSKGSANTQYGETTPNLFFSPDSVYRADLFNSTPEGLAIVARIAELNAIEIPTETSNEDINIQQNFIDSISDIAQSIIVDNKIVKTKFLNLEDLIYAKFLYFEFKESVEDNQTSSSEFFESLKELDFDMSLFYDTSSPRFYYTPTGINASFKPFSINSEIINIPSHS